MQRIVVANQKGGVGKTTSAVNVAASLGSQGLRVLAVDCDAQFALTRQLGVHSPEFSLVEVLQGTCEPESALVAVGALQVLPARRELAEIEQALWQQSGREWFLDQALDALVDRFDVAVIDTPPSLGQLTINALATAHLVLVPVSLEDEGAAQGLVELQARIGELSRVRKLAGRPERPEVVAFLNKSATRSGSREGRIAAQEIQHALEGLGVRVADARVPSRASVHQAAMYREPVVLREPDGLVARAFAQLSKDVLEEAA